MIWKEINKCRICGNKNLKTIVDLGNMSLTGVFPKSDEVVENAPLELVKCWDENNSNSSCGLVQLKHFYDLEKLYGDNYGYRSGLNHSMVEHLQKKVNNILEKIEICEGDLIIDIASNDGTLLGFYPSNLKLKLIGIDPTAAKFKQYYPEYAKFIPNFFSASLVKNNFSQKAKAITSIAMFYDLEDPIEFVREIKEVLSDDGVWVFEQSYMPEMIRNISYDTICHEHLEYYCLKQIKWIIDKAGLKIIDIDFNDANGGSFCVTVAKSNSKFKENLELVNDVLDKEKKGGFDGWQIFDEFKKNIFFHKQELIEFINDLKSKGKTIFGYGASTKGNVILQYCRLSVEEIQYIAEVNEYKFGRIAPGSGIPIISEIQARSLKPDYFMVLPWHFKNNIIHRESDYLRSGGHLFFPLPKIEVV